MKKNVGLVVALCVAAISTVISTVVVSGYSELKSLREENRKLHNRLELAGLHTSLLESSIGSAKFELFMLNSEVSRFRSGENWRIVVPRVEQQIQKLNICFVGIKGLQADLAVLSATLGREVLDPSLKTQSIDPVPVGDK